jgi:signal transduction histidine kinase
MKRGSKIKRSFHWLAVLIAIPLIAVLALLQYRWLDDNRIWNQQQMQGYLSDITNRFAAGFNDAVQEVVNSLQLPYRKSEYAYSIKNNEIIRRKREGKSYQEIVVDTFNTGISNLKEYKLLRHIKRIYLVECFDLNKSTCQEYNISSGSLASVTPDEYLSEIVTTLEKTRIEPQDMVAIPAGFFVLEFPALAIAAEPVLQTKEKDEKMSLIWTVVQFNQKSFTEDLVPYLQRKSVSLKDARQYEFQILDTRSENISYSSSPEGWKEAFKNHDAAAAVYDLNSRLVISKNAEDVGFETCLVQKHSVISIGQRVLTLTLGPALGENQLPPLALLARHRKGSIALAAEEQFAQNLILSYSVFAVLIISFVALYYSIIKTRRASQQQLNFVSGISHELKTPLTTICTAGENLKDTVVKGKDEIEYYGDVIYKEGAKLHDLVDQVLQYSGQISGKYYLDFKEQPLIEIIESALNDNHILFEEGGFDVSVNIPDKSIKVYCDKVKLASALRILISNALKYSGKSKRIELDIKQVLQGNKNKTTISVTDFGIGIPENEHSKVLTPFFRGDEVRETEIRGTGLGLSLANEIVQWHKGRLEFSSVHGEGSTFTIVLFR